MVANTKKDFFKYVAWSDEDQAYIGYCPSLFVGGMCHGDDEIEVYKTVCEIVDDFFEVNGPSSNPATNDLKISLIILRKLDELRRLSKEVSEDYR